MMSALTRELPGSMLRIADLDRDQIEFLIDLAADMKERPGHWRKELRGRTVACSFEQPSARMRVSIATAVARLGATPVMLRPDELQLGRGEPIADTARVLSGYCAAIVICTFAHRIVEEMARYASVPVINALTDDHNPCQALADLLTLRETFGQLQGLSVAYIGDGKSVANSLIEACAVTGIHLSIAAPFERQPSHEVVRWARAQLPQSGGSLSLKTEPELAVEGAHAVYTDAWVSMGEDHRRDEYLTQLAGYQVTADVMSRARDGAIFMHRLPAHRGEEVAAEVIDGVQSAVWRQAANRLPIEQALLQALTLNDRDR